MGKVLNELKSSAAGISAIVSAFVALIFFDGPVNDVVTRVKEALEQPVMSEPL